MSSRTEFRIGAFNREGLGEGVRPQDFPEGGKARERQSRRRQCRCGA